MHSITTLSSEGGIKLSRVRNSSQVIQSLLRILFLIISDGWTSLLSGSPRDGNRNLDKRRDCSSSRSTSRRQTPLAFREIHLRCVFVKASSRDREAIRFRVQAEILLTAFRRVSAVYRAILSDFISDEKALSIFSPLNIHETTEISSRWFNTESIDARHAIASTAYRTLQRLDPPSRL